MPNITQRTCASKTLYIKFPLFPYKPEVRSCWVNDLWADVHLRKVKGHVGRLILRKTPRDLFWWGAEGLAHRRASSNKLLYCTYSNAIYLNRTHVKEINLHAFRPALTSPLSFRCLISGWLTPVSQNHTCHSLLSWLFLKRWPRWLLTNAAFSALKSAPLNRLQEAFPHLLCSIVAQTSRYRDFCNIIIPSPQKGLSRLVPLDYCFYILLLFIPK